MVSVSPRMFSLKRSTAGDFAVAFRVLSQENMTDTVESRFLEPPGKTQIGSRNRRVREIGGNITLFD